MTDGDVQVHDTKWCPDCEARGLIDRFDTRSDDAAMAHTAGTPDGRERARVRARIYECPACSTRWCYYV